MISLTGIFLFTNPVPKFRNAPHGFENLVPYNQLLNTFFKNPCNPKGYFCILIYHKGKMHDEQLIRECSERNLKAQKMLYDRHSRKMMGVCLRYCRNEDQAKDLLQDGFIKVFEKISTYRGEGSLEAWIKKIFITTALEEIRRKKIDFVRLPDENVGEDEPVATDSNLQTQDLPEDLRRSIQSIDLHST